jgi:glycosyltransferase involved in cell wall biosynthesis
MLIDVTRLLYRLATGVIPTGIDRVCMEYVRHYADRARAVLSWRMLAAAASPADSARLFRTMLEGVDRVEPLALEMLVKSFVWNWLSPGLGRRILFNTSYLWTESSFYALQLRLFGARPVYFVHDLIPITHSEYFLPGQRRKHFDRMRVALTTGRGIIVNSRDTKDAVLRHAEAAGLRCPPIAVAPLAPAVLPVAESGPRPVAEPYFVVLSTIEPRKNHLLLLHLWRYLVRKDGPGAVPRLYVIGQRGWECENVVDMLERCEPLKGVVVERNRCTDRELASLLRHAQALLMPSFAEGYGMPVAEALAAGVPVIASELPAIREIAGDIPDYADPLDGMRWMELVRDYARPDSARRAAQLQRLGHFRPTTWAQHFAIVDDFLERLES